VLKLSSFSLLVFSILTIIARPAHAASIAYPGSFFFTAPAFVSGSPGDVTTSTLANGYSVTAEFCLDGNCQSPGSNNGSGSLHFTGVNITCDNEGGCGSLDVGFEALGVNTSFGLVGVDAAIDGTVSGTSAGFIALCIQDSSDICPSDLRSGNISFVTNFTSFSNVPALTGSFNSNGFFNLFGDLHLNSATAGALIILPNSLDISLDPAPGPLVVATPEPASLGLIGLGLVSLAGLRRRKK